MELEAVGGIPVGDLALQVGGQVDNVNSAERTFLGADTATDTEALGDECDLRLVGHLDTEFTGPNDGAGLFALLTTFLYQSASDPSKNRASVHTFGLH